MRLHFYCIGLVLGLGLFLVGCGPKPGCGYFGCGEGERCVVDDGPAGEACEPCGGPGQPCCYAVVGGEYCTTSGYGCDPGDGPGVCSKDCGTGGKPCCDDVACDNYNGYSCNYSTEVCDDLNGGGGGGGDPCFTGSTQYTFTIIAADCGTAWQTFYTNTLEEAEECRDAWATPGPGEEMCPVNVAPDESHVCKDGESFGYTLYHCSAQQLEACQDFYCGDPNGCTWAECE